MPNLFLQFFCIVEVFANFGPWVDASRELPTVVRTLMPRARARYSVVSCEGTPSDWTATIRPQQHNCKSLQGRSCPKSNPEKKIASLHRTSATSGGILRKLATFVRSGTGYGISPKNMLWVPESALRWWNHWSPATQQIFIFFFAEIRTWKRGV